MEDTKSFHHHPNIAIVLLWCVILGLMLFISIESTKPFKDELTVFKETVYQPSSTELGDYLERMKYEGLLQAYQLRLMRSIVLVALGGYGLFSMCRRSRIEMSNEAISVYNRWRRKPYFHKQWVDLSSIHIGQGQGIYGLLGQRGILLTYKNEYDATNSEFISLNGFEADQTIHHLLIELGDGAEVTQDHDYCEFVTVKDMIVESFHVFKNNYKQYYGYAVIFTVFATLQRYFHTSPIVAVATWAGLYFSFRAMIALYHHIYADINGIKTDFDTSWAYGETQFGRIVGASVLVEGFLIIFVMSSVGILMADLSLRVKVCGLIVLGLLTLFVYVRLYFVPYIGALTDKSSSYIGINSQLHQGYFKHKSLLSIISLTKVIVLCIVLWMTYDNLAGAMRMINRAVYVNIGVTFITAPYSSCCSIYCLKHLPLKNQVKDVEIDKEVKRGVEHEEATE